MDLMFITPQTGLCTKPDHCSAPSLEGVSQGDWQVELEGEINEDEEQEVGEM